MNLLKMLTNMLTSNAALQALSAKTGLPPKTLKMIIMIAVPLLLKRMTSNASSQTGASSLLGALGQHQSTKAVGEQLENVDQEDGEKIVGHILGEEQDDLVRAVAKEAGADPRDVSTVLGSISPTIMNGLSAATQSASGQQAQGFDLSDGFDMTDIMALFGGAAGAGQPAGNTENVHSGLLGEDTPAQYAAAPAQSAAPAGGGMSGLGSLFGSLLGGQTPETDQSVNGTQLIQSLLSLM